MSKTKLILLVTTVVAATLFVALLPTILSSPSALKLLLPQINRHTPGTISISSWQTRWNASIQVEGIKYSDPDKGVTLTLDKIAFEKGLLQLILAPRQIGEIVLHKPVVVLSHQSGSAAGNGTAVPKGAVEPSGEVSKSQGKKPIWEGVTGRIKVNYGKVLFQQGEGGESEAARDIVLEAELEGNRVNHSLHLLSGKQGRVDAEGFVNLPVYMHNILETLVSETQVSIAALDVGSLSALASLFGDFPEGSGIMYGSYTLRTSGVRDIHLTGKTSLRNLQCSGRWLGTDRPVYQKVHLEVDGGRDVRRGWYLSLLSLEADGISFTADGQQGVGDDRLRVNSTLDLAEFYQRFPELLNSRGVDRLESGKLRISADLTRNKDTFKVDTKAFAEDLKGMHKGKAFRWETPVELSVLAEKEADEVFIERFEIKAPFLQALGKGEVDNFYLQAEGDLEQVLAEVGKVIPLDWNGKGTLNLEVKTTPAENGRYQVDGNLIIDDFSLFKDGKQFLPAHELKLKGQALAGLAWLQGEGKLDAQLQCNSLPGELFIRAGNISRKADKISGHFSLSSELQLGQLTSLGEAFGILDGSQQFNGVLGLNVSGKLIDRLLLLSGLNGSIDNLETVINGVNYQEPRVVVFIRGEEVTSAPRKADSLQIRDLIVVRSWDDLTLEGNSETFVDFQQRKVFIDNLELESRTLKLALTQLTVSDWLKPMEKFSLRSIVNLDLAVANTVMEKMGLLPKEIDLAGQLGVTLQGQSLNEDSQRISLELQTDGLDIYKDNKFIVQDEQANLKGRLEGDIIGGNVQVPVVSLQSALLDLLASGVYKRVGSPSISLEGSMSPKLAQLGELLTRMSGHQVVMSGDRQHLFSLNIALNGKDGPLFAKLDFSAGLSADSVRYIGIDAQQLEFPIVSEKGLVEAALQGKVNGGRLSISPLADFTAEEPFIMVDEQSQVLDKVKLEKPLVDGVLGRIHPLFGLLAKPTGDVDMFLDNFSWPMAPDGAQRAVFKTRIDVSRVSLDSAGPLRQILGLVGIGDENLDLNNTEITCEAKVGRISCTPVRILVAGSEMTIKGSLGMDKTLDYLLDIPVTEQLVGKEGYRVLAGSSIKVPIHGTIGEPLFNQDTIEVAVRDLLQQAAVKTLEKQVDKVLPDVFNKIFGQ